MFIILILSNEKSLLKQIKNRLRAYKKEFDEPRKTQITDEETVNYKEEVKIETVYVLVDKFGYTKSVDTATYSRTTPESLAEYKHIVCLNNDDKLCVFSAQGNMYQVKVSSIPKTKIKDKGVLMHNLCKLGDEDIIAVTSFETLFESQTVFITKKGYIKRVSVDLFSKAFRYGFITALRYLLSRIFVVVHVFVLCLADVEILDPAAVHKSIDRHHRDKKAHEHTENYRKSRPELSYHLS